MDAEAQAFFSDSLARFFDPHFQSCMAGIKSVAGYDLEERYRAGFLGFHSYITDPQPRFISELREDPKKEHWYHLLVNGVLGNVQSSFSCVLYHQERLRNVEKNLMEVLSQYNLTERMGGSTLGVGGTSVLDFEYQAYVLAYRRCLDQFAGAIAAFFKNKYSSFRTLPAFLERRKPQEVAIAISETHSHYAKDFEFVFSEGGVTSVRDKIAHYEFVPAGCINISARGIVLVGGGENLNFNFTDNHSLTEILSKKSDILYQCIEDVLRTFIKSVSQWEDSRKE